MTDPLWRVRWEEGPEGPYRVGVADPAPAAPGTPVPARPGASVLFLLGRGDSLELRADVARRLTTGGAQVVALEHVGQGASAGLGRRPDAVHVGSFSTHVMAAVGEADRLRGPAVLLGHSMGGLVGAHLMAARPRCFQTAVLTSPMWGWAGGASGWLAGGLATVAVRTGHGTRFAAGERPFSTAACLSMRGADDDQAARLIDLADRHPDLMRGGSTWGWVLAASRSMRQLRRLPLEQVETDVTVLSCSEDTTVSLSAHQRLSRRLPRARVVRVTAGHDPFVAGPAARSALWHEIGRALHPTARSPRRRP